MKKIFMVTLGCSKNSVDAEVILGSLVECGYKVVKEPGNAEIIIVNTCGFIQSAKEESIEEILSMMFYKTDGICKCLIVSGCLSERYRENLAQELPEVDIWLGINAWQSMAEVINIFFAPKRPSTATVNSFIKSTKLYGFKNKRYNMSNGYSRYVKVADGCRNCCTYCAIPLIRGDFRSREIESIVNETELYVQEGVREINLIAQDTTSYGIDIYGKLSLDRLLDKLSSIKGDFWLRILYCYPKYLSDSVIDIMIDNDKICNYIDLPLQHIHNDILRRMNRKDGEKDIRSLLDKIKTKIPNVALRTTFILGFPGETQEHFERLYRFVEQYSFTNLGAFMYSPEEGTKAALFPEQVPLEIVEERYHQLMSLQSKISESENKKMVGKELTLLAEEDADAEGRLTGRTFREAPEVDGTVFVDGANGVKVGDFIKVCIDEGYAYDLSANKV